MMRAVARPGGQVSAKAAGSPFAHEREPPQDSAPRTKATLVREAALAPARQRGVAGRAKLLEKDP